MSAATLPAGTPVATIRTEVHIDAPAGEVWDAVRDVGEVHKRLVPGFVTDAFVENDVRTVTFANGFVVKERITSIDDDARRLAYGAVEGRATYHSASIEVVADGEGARLIWITDFLPQELGPFIGGNMEQGAAVMKTTLEAAASGRRAGAARP